MKIVLNLARLCIVVVLVGCTERNPNVCCTTAEDCMAQGLPTATSCAEGLLCRGNQCIAQPCTSSLMCDSAAPYCSSTCQKQCSDDAQCPGFGQAESGRFCVSGGCVQCREDVDCPEATPVCESASCRKCVIDDDCASQYATSTQAPAWPRAASCMPRPAVRGLRTARPQRHVRSRARSHSCLSRVRSFG